LVATIARNAIAALNGKVMNGRALTVNESKPRAGGRGGGGSVVAADMAADGATADR
jgi:hypothetical protein